MSPSRRGCVRSNMQRLSRVIRLLVMLVAGGALCAIMPANTQVARATACNPGGQCATGSLTVTRSTYGFGLQGHIDTSFLFLYDGSPSFVAVDVVAPNTPRNILGLPSSPVLIVIP